MVIFEKINSADLKEAAALIARLIVLPECMIAGFIGATPAEVLRSLEDLSDVPATEAFAVAKEDGKIIGIIGFAAELEKRMIYMIGPFIIHNNWQLVANELWTLLNNLIPSSIDTMKLGMEKRNENCTSFYEEQGFKKYNEEANLILNRKGWEQVIEPLAIGTLQLYNGFYKNQFQLLHPKNVYYTASEILRFVEEDKLNRLLIIKEDELLTGYSYVEISPEFHKAMIHFITIREEHRNKGYGTHLLFFTLKNIFQFPEVEEVNVTVRLTNHASMKLVKRLLFEEKEIIVAYKKVVEVSDSISSHSG